MSDARTSVDERAEAYLDGTLTSAEAAAFERELGERAEAAEALGAAVVLRELLAHLPPDAPPAGLERRIVDALRLGDRARPEPEGEEAGEPAPSLGTVRAALGGTSWLFRPSAAVLGGLGGARPAAAGFAQVRWLLGPVAARRAGREPAPARPLWRRALGGLGRLGGLA